MSLRSLVRAQMVLSWITVVPTSAAFGWGHEVTKEKEDYRFLNQTESRDFLGRWRTRSVSHHGKDDELPAKFVASIDIVPCGRRFCGVAVGIDGTCGAKLLDFEDRGPGFAETVVDEPFHRFSGSLQMDDSTGKYVVDLDVFQDDAIGGGPRHNDNTTLQADGSSDGFYGRDIPLEVSFSYAGRATCKAPIS